MESFRRQFQSQVFASYEAIHQALADRVPADAPASAGPAELKGVLAGQFIVSDSLTGLAETLPLASVLAGACFLGLENNTAACREMLRTGRCDFVVNSLDEALRILKNELRQKKPVSVCLSGNVPAVLQQMADRGVAPDLLMHTLPADEYPALRRMAETGALLCRTSGLAQQQGRPANADGELTWWSLPRGNAAMLARLDAVARDIVPAADRKRRRWLESASRFLPRSNPPFRVASFIPPELERLLDAISSRLMSGDITGPVNINVEGKTMALGANHDT